ncbi:MAG: nitrate/nitrite transporter, partial [Nitrospinota bacterium]
FLGREIGLAMGIFSTAYPLGTLLSFNAFGYLGAAFGWRAPVLVSVGTGALALAIFLLNCREAQEEGPPERAPFRLSMIVGIGLPIWLLAFTWTSFESVIISFLTFAPDYFLGKGMSLAFASALPALIMAGPIVIQPLVGWGVDRLGRKEYFIGIGGIFLALLMVVMAGERESYLFPIILMGFFLSLVPSPLFAFPPELVGPLYLGLGFGIVNSFSNVGRVLAPYLVGAVRDYTGDYRAAFFVMSLLGLGVTLNIVLLALRRRRKGV